MLKKIILLKGAIVLESYQKKQIQGGCVLEDPICEPSCIQGWKCIRGTCFEDPGGIEAITPG